MLVSFYRKVGDKYGTTANMQAVLNGIKNGKWKQKVMHVREHPIHTKAWRQAKENIPCATFSGTFYPHRSIKNIQKFSGKLIFDVDHMKDEDEVEAMFQALQDDEYTYCIFRSTSGDGLKILVNADFEYSSANFKTAYNEIAKHLTDWYGTEIDTSGKDVSRLCLVSYDPNMYINEDAKSFTPQGVMTTPKDNLAYSFPQDIVIAYQNATKFTDKQYTFQEGSRNNYIYQLACFLCQIGIDKETSLELIDHNIQTPNDEWKQSIDSAYKKVAHEFGTLSKFKGLRDNAKVVRFNTQHVEGFDGTNRTLSSHIYSLSKFIYSKISEDHSLCSSLLEGYFYYLQTIANDVLDSEIYIKAKQNAFESYGQHNMTNLKPNRTVNLLGNIAENMKTDNIVKVMGSFNLRLGNSYGVVGPEGGFKSMTTVKICKDIVTQTSGYCIYFNFEMSQFQFMRYLINMGLSIDIGHKDIKHDFEKYLGSFQRDFDDTGLSKILHNDEYGINMQQIYDYVRSSIEVMGYKPTVIVFDGLDGIGTTDNVGDNERRTRNTAEIKNIAKEHQCICLYIHHSRSEAKKHQRDQSEWILSGRKLKANTDGFISNSLLIDPDETNVQIEQFRYKERRFHIQFKDRREEALMQNYIVELPQNIDMKIIDEDPKDYEYFVIRNELKKMTENNDPDFMNHKEKAPF